jgi:two-component system response regulator RegX3
MQDVLIVEDDQEIAKLIRLYLNVERLAVTWVPSAEEAVPLVSASSFSLVILDINLPGMDGFDFLELVRRGCDIPVIIVSSRESDEDKLRGLGLGADDFMTKPFSPKFLAAKALALLRRVGSVALPAIAFGPYSLDLGRSVLSKRGEPVFLRKKEWDLLAYMASHPGEMLSPEKIYRAVWGQGFGDLTTVSVHVQRLRQKIEDIPSRPKYIKTNTGFGYYFTPEGNG